VASKQVTIITASEPNNDTKSLLATVVADKTGIDAASILFKIDSNLLGGCIIQVDDNLIDLSLKKKIASAKTYQKEHISV